MTVQERLRELGLDESETHGILKTLLKLVPLGRPVVLDDEILAAARSGDFALVSFMLAEEVTPDPEEVTALEEAQADALRGGGGTVSVADTRGKLGLPRAR